jgi:hypothetical protein
MGDTGKEVQVVEFEPLPDEVPQEQPVTVPEREEVPA